MTQHGDAPIERRATGRKEQLVAPNWHVDRQQRPPDRLAQVILDDPTVRLKAVHRLEAIVTFVGC